MRASAYDTAVRMLSARALSAAEVRLRLTRRGHAKGEIESALRALSERRYLDDRALAYNVGSFLAERRRFGRLRIAAELARRGIPSKAAREALERVYEMVDEEELALQAARAHARAAQGSRRTLQTVRERLTRSLLRRGFPWAVVAKVVRAVEDGSGTDASHDPPARDHGSPEGVRTERGRRPRSGTGPRGPGAGSGAGNLDSWDADFAPGVQDDDDDDF